MKNILITICARGGSKGIPGKNIIIINGKPLIQYTIDTALSFAKNHNAEIVLSTDSEAIRRVVKNSQIERDYIRPDYLADDNAGKPDAIKDVVEWAEKKHNKTYDFIVDLDVTSPIRTLKDIEGCLALVTDNPETLTSFSVSPCKRNPYFNMVEEKEDGYCKVVLGGKYKTRQSAPKVFDMNASIYVYRREVFNTENPRAVTERSRCYVVDHICFDLDDPEDFDYLEFLISNGKLSDILI